MLPVGEPLKSEEKSESTTEAVVTEMAVVGEVKEEPPKRRSMELSEKGKAALQRKWERDLKKAPKDGIVQVNEKQAIKAAKKLGYSQAQWNVATLRAKQELGHFLSTKITARILLVNDIDTLEQVRAVAEVGKKLAENTDLAAKERIAAIGMVAHAGKVCGELSDQILKLAQAADEKANSNSNGKPKNLPPSVGVEMINADGSKVAIVAKSGEQS